jgi:uncharacterized protein
MPTAELWPRHGLDLDRLTAGGWRPSAFNQFVVKVHSRCNLACDYCYVYESADQSWRDQPRLMTEATFARACEHIAGHARRHDVPVVSLVFHGGEPLLAGAGTLDRFATLAKEIIAAVRFGVQTNGILLDAAFLDVFARHDVRVAVSVDGDRAGHDRHRLTKQGTGSYDQVIEGLNLLLGRPFRRLYSGLLCTVDLANDPVATYEALAALEPPIVDFLLPHANWATPPAGPPGAYGRWLITVFDHWFRQTRPQPRIRLFEDVMTLLLGGRSSGESVGLSPIRVAVVETDGSLEQVDALRTTYAGATRIALRTDENPLDEALRDPAIVARQIGAAALGDTCLRCSLRTVCGGGNYTHRYDPATGFRNPSVYCADLTALIGHIDATVRGDVARILAKGRTVD